MIQIIPNIQTPLANELFKIKGQLNNEDKELINSIKKYLEKQENAIGVAFNQLADAPENTKISDLYKYRINKPGFISKEEEVFLNPEIVKCFGKTFGTKEWCLTWQGQTLKAERYQKITLKYETINSEIIIQEFSGTKAHLIQHEMNHINGIEEKFYTKNDYLKPLPQRNELCICNSGKKFKKCCINNISDYYNI